METTSSEQVFRVDCGYCVYYIIIIKSVQLNNNLLSDTVNYVPGSQFSKKSRDKEKKRLVPDSMEHRDG